MEWLVTYNGSIDVDGLVIDQPEPKPDLTCVQTALVCLCGCADL